MAKAKWFYGFTVAAAIALTWLFLYYGQANILCTIIGVIIGNRVTKATNHV